MLLDRKLDTFRALGCNRGAKYMFRSVGIKVAQSVVKAGYTPGSAKPENVLQLGGAFLVSKDRVRGKLRLSRYTISNRNFKSACTQRLYFF